MDERGIRVNDLILSLVATGLSGAEVIEYIEKSKEWNGADKKTIQTGIKAANKTLKNMAVYQKDFEIGKALFRLNELYKKSLAIQDYKGCLAIQKEIDGLIVTSDTKVETNPEDAL